MDATFGSIGLSWGQLGSVEIARVSGGAQWSLSGSVEISEGQWGTLGFSGAQWGSVGVSGAQWGSVGVTGAQRSSVCNVYTPSSLVLNKFGKIEAHQQMSKKRSFERYCSFDKAWQFSAIQEKHTRRCSSKKVFFLASWYWHFYRLLSLIVTVQNSRTVVFCCKPIYILGTGQCPAHLRSPR